MSLFYHFIKNPRTKKQDMSWEYGTLKHNDDIYTNTYMHT